MNMMADMPQQKSVWGPIRRWWWNRQFKKAKLALGVMLANRDPEIYTELGKAANEIARKMCMQWLDNQGMQHCAKCPNTKPLVSLGGVFYCAPHAGQAVKDGKARAATLEVAK